MGSYPKSSTPLLLPRSSVLDALRAWQVELPFSLSRDINANPAQVCEKGFSPQNACKNKDCHEETGSSLPNQSPSV
jgi:hypothetical protein